MSILCIDVRVRIPARRGLHPALEHRASAGGGGDKLLLGCQGGVDWGEDCED